MIQEEVHSALCRLTGHQYLEVVLRGNSAITSALSIVPQERKVLIPAEGGWIHYKIAPKKLKLKVEEVKCHQAKIDLEDLGQRISSKKFSTFLYQNPGGYFAEQPMKEIYEICSRQGCLVVMDVSGAIGTKLCEGHFADILVGSFGDGKLVEAKGGGFISAKEKRIWDLLLGKRLEVLTTEGNLKIIKQKLDELPQRIEDLITLREKIILDLKKMKLMVLHPGDTGFVVVVLFTNEEQKEKIINYCQDQRLEWTECPRYIRVLEKALSIEIKRKER